jgi:hypothetical protein
MIGQMDSNGDSHAGAKVQVLFDQGRIERYLLEVYRARSLSSSDVIIRAYAIAMTLMYPRIACRLSAYLQGTADENVANAIWAGDFHQIFNMLSLSGASEADRARSDSLTLYCLVWLSREDRYKIPVAALSDSIRFELITHTSRMSEDDATRYRTEPFRKLHTLRELYHMKSVAFDDEFRRLQGELAQNWYYYRAGVFGYMMLKRDDLVLINLHQCRKLSMSQGPMLSAVSYYRKRLRILKLLKVSKLLAKVRMKRLHRRRRMEAFLRAL